MITPSLRTSTDTRVVFLDFDKDFPELFEILSDIIASQIEGLNLTQYSYNMFSTDSPRSHKLLFSFRVSSTKTPLLTLSLNLPISLLNDPMRKLTSAVMSIRMKSYFSLDENALNSIESTQESTKTGGSVASATAGIASFASTGSSIAFRSLMLMEVIKFLR
jgi:hypothetical protein